MSAIFNDTPTISASTTSALASNNGSGGAIGAHLLLANAALQSEAQHQPPEDLHRPFPVGLQQINSNGVHFDANYNNPKIRLTPTIKLMATPNPADPKRKFVCPYENCTKSYGKSSHLRSHLTWHTGIKPFVCQEASCGKGFTRSDELNRHIRTHTGEKPFECVQCTKKFSRSDHLTKHLATHAKQLQNPAVKRMRPAQQHQHNNGTSEIPAGASQLADHHKVYGTPEAMEFNDGMHFMAALMGNTLDRTKQRPMANAPENLTHEPVLQHMPIKIKLERPEHSGNYHVVSTHGTIDTDDEEPMIKAVSTMICPNSPENDRTDSNDFDETDDDTVMPEANALPQLTHHNNNTVNGGAHIASGANANANANATATAHDTERPYRCNQCVKSFKRQDDLNRHIRTHTGEKPYTCSECGRRFMRNDHLKKHLKTHSKLR